MTAGLHQWKRVCVHGKHSLLRKVWLAYSAPCLGGAFDPLF